MQYLLDGSIERVASLVKAARRLLALGNQLLMQVASLQRPHPPRIAYPLQIFRPRRIVEKYSAARFADALRIRATYTYTHA